MFCYQLNIATINLMHPGIVDIKYKRDATDDDMPLITVCPTNQTNLTRILDLGYYHYDHMLWGDAKCSGTTWCWCTTWGAHTNLTFDEVKEQVFDFKKVNRVEINEEKVKSSSVFLTGYGICKEYSLLYYAHEIELYHRNQDDSRVFITDRNYSSFIMPDTASHVGKEIFMKPDTNHFINVEIKESYNCKKDENPMSGEEYEKCVDDKIQKEFDQNNISCIPPWLSDKNQCNQT